MAEIRQHQRRHPWIKTMNGMGITLSLRDFPMKKLALAARSCRVVCVGAENLLPVCVGCPRAVMGLKIEPFEAWGLPSSC